MKKKFLIILCLVLFIFSVAAVSAAEDVNQTITEDTNNVVNNVDTLSVSATEDVNQTYDDALSVSTDNEISAKDAGTFTALQEKINNAPRDSTIYLENDYKYDEGFSSEGIEIKYGDLTIDGNGHTIDGKNMARIFKIGADVYDVTLNNIKFINGYYDKSEGGGAIYYSSIYSSHKAVIEDCTFVNNLASENGGAIYTRGKTDIVNCTFRGNHATGGSAIYSGSHSTAILRSNFLNNVATGYGGAVRIVYGGIFNSLFDSNTAKNGGAVFAYNCLIDSCEFNMNSADMGGAICTSEPSISRDNYKVIVENSYFNDNVVSQNGASIAALGAADINNCNFMENGNHESIYFKSTEEKNKLNITNNYIESDFTYDIYYNASRSFNFKTYLVFENETVAPNDAVTVCKLYDDGYNIIRLFNNRIYNAGYDLKAIFTNVNDPSIKYERSVGYFDEKTGGYRLRCDFKEGVYKVTGYLSSKFTDNCEVIDGYLTVGSTVLNVPDVTKNYGGSERLEVTLTENNNPIAGAKININLNGVDYPKTTDTNGKASMAINLPAGTYPATVTYEDISTTAKVTVNQLATKTSLSSSKNSHNSVTLTATINPSTATGNVVFNVNGKDYSAKVSDSKATYTLNNLAIGSYEAKATYNGDANHKASSSNSVKFTVEEVKIDVRAPDLTKYYKGSERFVVTVKENNVPLAGKNVTINLNGKPYTRITDEKGEASMAINLNSGVYNVTSEFDGIKVDSKITVRSTVSGKDVTKIFRNGTQYYATFVDTKGNLIKNTDVKFNINGVFYTRTTDDKGVAKMNINLPPGTYILTAENPNSTEKYTNVIKVLPSIVENYDLTKYYKNASKYTLRVIGDNGKPVGEGVSVKLNINGVFYERKTNASGYMSMNINLPPGTYTVTAEYNGLRASNKITVLSVLETKDLVMKYKDGSKFEAKILDGQGNPYAGQTVTFNINGVFYTKTTGADGIARLKINLLAGEYIITSMYNGLNSANKVTISG